MTWAWRNEPSSLAVCAQKQQSCSFKSPILCKKKLLKKHANFLYKSLIVVCASRSQINRFFPGFRFPAACLLLSTEIVRLRSLNLLIVSIRKVSNNEIMLLFWPIRNSLESLSLRTMRKDLWDKMSYNMSVESTWFYLAARMWKTVTLYLWCFLPTGSPSP